LLPSLDAIGVNYTLKIALRNITRMDVIFIQKRVNKKVLTYARLAKLLGKTIIYDIDDLGPHMWYFLTEKHFKKILRLVDIITVGSPAQKEFLESEYGKTNIVVLPCTVDYFPEKPVRNDERADKTLRLLWFGGIQNFHMFERYLDALKNVPMSKILVITTNHQIDQLQSKYPFIDFKIWTLDTFLTNLRSCDLSILSHEGSNQDRAKTNNKMIASITWGVPALVSKTPDYEATANEAEIGDAVFSSEEELLQKIEQFRSSIARENYLDKAQPIIWSKYSPTTISKLLLIICSSFSPMKFLNRLRNVFLSM